VIGGILLTVAGVWVLSQVLGGNALGRLGITGAPTEPGTTHSVPNTISGGATFTYPWDMAKIGGS
jgi:hypothetical protein